MRKSRVFCFPINCSFCVVFIEADVLRFILDQDLRCKQVNIVAITGLGFHSTVPGKLNIHCIQC